MVSHQLTAEVGLVCAAVYGSVWRYCQMKDGICRASYATIGEGIDIDRRTVMRNVEKLCQRGYLIDTTPDCKNAPHAYILGKTIAQNNSLGVSQSHTCDDIGVSQSHPEIPPGVSQSHSRSVTKSLPGVSQSHPNRDINRESNRVNVAPRKIISPEQNKLFLTLANLCHINLRVTTKGQINQLDQTAETLIQVVKDIDQFKDKFAVYWLTVDWRGKQGQSPTPAQVREVYGDYSYWLENGGKNGNQQKVSISAK